MGGMGLIAGFRHWAKVRVKIRARLYENYTTDAA